MINNYEEEESSCPSDYSYASTLEEVIEKGDEFINNFNEKLEEFHNRNDSEYHAKKKAEADKKASDKELAMLQLQGVILEDKKEELEREGYTLADITPCGAYNKQYVITI